ncbi:MAG: thiolase family protein [Acidimicrobiales bacterium]
MRDAVIVEAVRTPLGKRHGALSDVHPVDLSAHVLTALIERAGIDSRVVDDVLWGCVMQTGEQSVNVGRNAWLGAGFSEEVPGTTIDRQCGSSQQAVHFAAQAVMSGVQDVVVAGGVESMTRVPMLITAQQGPGLAYGPLMRARYRLTDELALPQGPAADAVARAWGLSRLDLDAFALRSHRLASRSRDENRFQRETIPIKASDPQTGEVRIVSDDECIRRDTSSERLASLRPVFDAEGTVTAGNASQISDGAAALLVTTPERARELQLTPRARIRAMAMAATDPVLMLTAPIPATRRVLERAGLTPDDIDLVEINEAFASVVLAWSKELDWPLDNVNVNGGAIAMGHPLGCSGARLMVTLLHELERTGGRYGLQTMCEGGGMANATIIERL